MPEIFRGIIDGKFVESWTWIFGALPAKDSCYKHKVHQRMLFTTVDSVYHEQHWRVLSPLRPGVWFQASVYLEQNWRILSVLRPGAWFQALPTLVDCRNWAILNMQFFALLLSLKSDFLRMSRIGRHSRKIDFSFISPKHTFEWTYSRENSLKFPRFILRAKFRKDRNLHVIAVFAA